MNSGRDHERWAELAAAHALSALDAPDDAEYLRHAESCEECRQLESDINATLAELAQTAPGPTPPPTLKSAILRAAAEDTTSSATDELRARRDHATSRQRRPSAWISAAAAVVAITIAVTVWALNRPAHPSIAARCASVHCPTTSLLADGKPVATVMVLDDVAYVQASNLPAPAAGHSYVLWRISAGQSPAGIAAMQLHPNADPVRAGALPVPVTAISSFALSEEPGKSVPATPTDVVAQGKVG